MATLDPAVISAIAQAVTVAMQATHPGGNRADHKALGGPPDWDSGKDESGFVEWHIKVKAWLTNQDDRALRWLNTARDADVVLETDDLDTQHFQTEAERNACKRFNGLPTSWSPSCGAKPSTSSQASETRAGWRRGGSS